MGDISQLKDSVLGQAHEKGRLLLAEAQEKIKQDSQASLSRLEQDKLQQRQARLKDISRRAQRELQQLENQKRQSTLVTKQRVLQELFEEAAQTLEAWTAQQEWAFLDGVLQAHQGQELVLTLGALSRQKYGSGELEKLLQAYPQVRLAEETLPGQAGFVLSQGQIDETYLYRELVDAIWQEESYRLAQDIFRDQAD